MLLYNSILLMRVSRIKQILQNRKQNKITANVNKSKLTDMVPQNITVEPNELAKVT